MLIYPPGDLYQRGEDRCQLNINKSSVNTIRACNDLGYAAAVLKNNGYSIYLKDYQSENLGIDNLFIDIKNYNPDVIFISTTNATVIDDLKIIKDIKNLYPSIIFILKGAIFFNCNYELFKNIDFSCADYMIGGEEEFVISDLINAHFNNKKDLSKIQGIVYKSSDKFIITPHITFNDNLNLLPFPDRGEMNNNLYIMPDTGESLATISTSRGCPSSCIYCLSPHISGRKVRFRSAQNILEEMEECYNKYKIRNFFFKSDTFTINKQWTIELCKKISESNLNNKIRWMANSRVDTIDEEILAAMKAAGCSVIAFGLESGSDESLKKMKKNTTVEKNYNAVQMAKKAGLQTVGFYIIGFPWETKEHLEETRKAILRNNTDFIELHIATPFTGTELYDMVNNVGKIENQIYGKNHFTCAINYTTDLTPEYVEEFRRKVVLQYYLRPNYIITKTLYGILRPKVLCNY
ncbi:MAG: B12-binding domain-containing radical SAM protein, partial [Candidatus Gastranaerophilales bacterium]|nr:B12-binding domain-containing radical SAM protein [Candidatus Gastranaerophilales bacterium]